MLGSLMEFLVWVDEDYSKKVMLKKKTRYLVNKIAILHVFFNENIWLVSTSKIFEDIKLLDKNILKLSADK